MAMARGRLAEIVDVRTLCRSFPPMPAPCIDRPEILAEIEDLFTKGMELVTVEGDDGKGKTTLLAQAALRHPEHTVALFARSTSRYSYDYLYLLTDLCEQLYWRVYGEARPDSGRPPDDSEYGMLLTNVEGRARKTGRPIYFVIDGLDEIPDEDQRVREQLFSLVPFGRQQFRFLYAGRPGAATRIKERTKLPEMRVVSWPLTRFTLEETRRYLEHTELSISDIRELHEISNGLPVYLEMIKQVLQGESTPNQLMANLPKTLADLLAYQWRSVSQVPGADKELIEQALAFLVFDYGRHTLQSLAGLIGVSIERLAQALAPLGFVRMLQDNEEIDRRKLGWHDSAHQGSTAGIQHSDLHPDIDESHEVELTFASDAMRTYACSRLDSLKQLVLERVATQLQTTPMSADAQTRLPTVLAELGRTRDLIDYLSPQYFVALIEQQRPLSDAMAAAALGIRASGEQSQEFDLARFSLMRALFLDLGRGSVGVEEVEAYMALNAEEKALALALSVPLVEDRLELLAAVAKARFMDGKPIHQEMREQLESLAALVDPEALGDRATNIGVMLLFSAPNAALRFLDRLEADKISADDAGARQSRLLAAKSDSEQSDWLQDVSDHESSNRSALSPEHETFAFLQASLHDPIAQRLAVVLSVVYERNSADDILNSTSTLTRPQDQIFVLRMWLRRNTRRGDTVLVIEKALDLVLLHSDELMPSAAAFRDIAAPLTEIPNVVETSRLVGRVDTIANQTEHRGPSRDYVRLQLQLARAECRYDADKCNSRILATWYFATERGDLIERASCVAQVVSALPGIESSAHAASQRSPIQSNDVREMEEELESLIEHLLTTCSDQYHATRGVIAALAPRYPRRALDIAMRLNTQQRRRMATLDVLRRAVSSISTRHPESIIQSVDVLKVGLPILADTVQRDITLLQIARRVSSLSRAKKKRRTESVESPIHGDTADVAETAPEATVVAATAQALRMTAYLLPYLDECRSMIGGLRRIQALAHWEMGLRQLSEQLASNPTMMDEQRLRNSSDSFPMGALTHARLSDLIKQTEASVDTAWESLDSSWAKVSHGFDLAHMFASVAKPRAQQYLGQAESARRDLLLPSANARLPYVVCLWLTGRAFVGLLDQRLETDGDLLRLKQVIDVLPGWGERAAAWADIAVRCFLNKREDIGRKIVVNHIYKLLNLVSKGDAQARFEVIAASAPALYLMSEYRESARQQIAQVPRPRRDVIYAQIAEVFITQTPPGDPFNSGLAGGRPLSYEEAQEICRLIEEIELDGLLYDVVAKLADCIVSGRKHAKMSRDHQHDIAERVRRYVESRLPDKANITHEGYKLIALMQVARMEPNEARGKDAHVWADLFQRATEIPNLSDRAFVQGHLAVTTPDSMQRDPWLQETENSIQSIGARLNRIDSYVEMARLILRANWGDRGAALARKWLKQAMATAAESPKDASTFTAQRAAIDLAYQFDETLARELTQQSDDDPARLKHRLYTLETKQRLGTTSGLPSRLPSQSAQANPDAVPDESPDERDQLRALAEAAGLSVAALLANRISTVTADALREPLKRAARLPLSEAFPIYAWAIENAVRRFAGDARQARVFLRPLFESIMQVTLMAPQLVEDVAARSASASGRPLNAPDDSIAEGELIRSGEREKAEQAIRDWCLSHPSPYVKLSDRYFGPEQLSWVRLIAESMPEGCKITILTSRQGQKKANVAMPWSRTYQLHWKARISDLSAPPAEVIILGTKKDGVAPFHDRRMICAGAGLAFSTSLNSLGGASNATMNALTHEQLEETERNLDEWARGGAWEYKGERLLHDRFFLDDPDA